MWPFSSIREARNTARRYYRENKRLRAIIATGHFRDPATGRLGKRGRVFEVSRHPNL